MEREACDVAGTATESVGNVTVVPPTSSSAPFGRMTIVIGIHWPVVTCFGINVSRFYAVLG